MKSLIFGGNASIAADLIEIFSIKGYDVFNAVSQKQYSKSVENTICFNDRGELSAEHLRAIEGLDALVYCIGKLHGKAMTQYSNEEIFDSFHSNVMLTIKSLKSLLPVLNANASVVFIGSISASNGSFDEVYSASKSGLYGLTKSLARKSTNGIRYNCVSPGLIENTNMYKRFSKSEIRSHRAATPTGDLVGRADLAKICFDICQQHWKSLNGQVIDVNGGRYV